jgi:hypothetical protein
LNSIHPYITTMANPQVTSIQQSIYGTQCVRHI